MFNLFPSFWAEDLRKLGTYANVARADRRSAGRDVGTLQVISNHVVVRSLSTSNDMAKVNLPMGIRSISGKVGNVCFRTMKGSGKVYMSTLPAARKSALRPREVVNQNRFAKRAEIVRMMRKAGSKLPVRELWKLVSQVI